MRLNYFRKLLPIPGYFIAKMTVEPHRGRRSVILELKRLRGPHQCPECSRKISKPHSSWPVTLQHLRLWEYPTYLNVRHYRLDCPECGLVTEPIPFAVDGPMATRSLAELTHEMCKVMAGKKFILLSRQAHVRGKAREALNDLLGASRIELFRNQGYTSFSGIRANLRSAMRKDKLS